jgi:hypothetical protein
MKAGFAGLRSIADRQTSHSAYTPERVTHPPPVQSSSRSIFLFMTSSWP